MMDNELPVMVERNGAVAWLWLNRPQSLNALTQQARVNMMGELEKLAADPPHVLIVSGKGRGFCVGQDLNERAESIRRGEVQDLSASLELSYNPLIRTLSAMPCVTVAAVNGVTAGAGIGIALACDLLVATRSAKFLLGFGKIGLGPDAGVSLNLARRIGPARALALTLGGGAITAGQALDWGMAAHVFDDDSFIEQTGELAAMLSAGSLDAQLAARNLILHPSADLAAQLDRERDSQGHLGRTAYFEEQVLAFTSKG